MSTITLLDLANGADDPADEATPATPEPEPRVLTQDVAKILRVKVRPGDEDSGESVALIAERADTSTRTVYRVLSESTETLGLALADRLVMAADSHLVYCRLRWSDGRVTGYADV